MPATGFSLEAPTPQEWQQVPGGFVARPFYADAQNLSVGIEDSDWGYSWRGFGLINRRDNSLVDWRGITPGTQSATANGFQLDVSALTPGVDLRIEVMQGETAQRLRLKETLRLSEAFCSGILAYAANAGLVLDDHDLFFAVELDRLETSDLVRDGGTDGLDIGALRLGPSDLHEIVISGGFEKSWDSSTPAKRAHIHSKTVTRNGKHYYLFGSKLSNLALATAPVYIDPDTGINSAYYFGYTAVAKKWNDSLKRSLFGYPAIAPGDSKRVANQYGASRLYKSTAGTFTAYSIAHQTPLIKSTDDSTAYVVSLYLDGTASQRDRIQVRKVTGINWETTAGATIGTQVEHDFSSGELNRVTGRLNESAGTSGRILCVSNRASSNGDFPWAVYDINTNSFVATGTLVGPDGGGNGNALPIFSLTEVSEGRYCSIFNPNITAAHANYGDLYHSEFDFNTNTWSAYNRVYDNTTSSAASIFLRAVSNPTDHNEVWVYGEFYDGSTYKVRSCKTTDLFSTTPTWSSPWTLPTGSVRGFPSGACWVGGSTKKHVVFVGHNDGSAWDTVNSQHFVVDNDVVGAANDLGYPMGFAFSCCRDASDNGNIPYYWAKTFSAVTDIWFDELDISIGSAYNYNPFHTPTIRGAGRRWF